LRRAQQGGAVLGVQHLRSAIDQRGQHRDGLLGREGGAGAVRGRAGQMFPTLCDPSITVGFMVETSSSAW
jgi:hypothetical protein